LTIFASSIYRIEVTETSETFDFGILSIKHE